MGRDEVSRSGRTGAGTARIVEGDMGMVRHRALVAEELHLTYKTAEDPVRAVCGVTITVTPGEFFTWLGASGCGKTTVLRCIAGLESLDRCRMAIGD